MFYTIDIQKILFIDIETVPANANFDGLSEKFQELWRHKAEKIKGSESDTPETLYERAGIYAEFGKIICISVGTIRKKLDKYEFYVKSYSGHNEKDLLVEFAEMLYQYDNSKEILLCAHNGKEFDFPFIARRMLINKIHLPEMLNLAGKKPWEVNLLDTMELWKFGDFKSYTSLDLLTTVFDIATPKDDISGKDVAKVYYKENDLPRIVKYCQKDVLAIAQLFLSFQGKALIEPDSVFDKNNN